MVPLQILLDGILEIVLANALHTKMLLALTHGWKGLQTRKEEQENEEVRNFFHHGSGHAR
jgi:hypothetical protein